MNLTSLPVQSCQSDQWTKKTETIATKAPSLSASWFVAQRAWATAVSHFLFGICVSSSSSINARCSRATGKSLPATSHLHSSPTTSARRLDSLLAHCKSISPKTQKHLIEKFNLAWQHGCTLGQDFPSCLQARTALPSSVWHWTMKQWTMMSQDAFQLGKTVAKSLLTMHTGTWKMQINCKTCMPEKSKNQPKISYKMGSGGLGRPRRLKMT